MFFATYFGNLTVNDGMFLRAVENLLGFWRNNDALKRTLFGPLAFGFAFLDPLNPTLFKYRTVVRAINLLP